MEKKDRQRDGGEWKKEKKRIEESIKELKTKRDLKRQRRGRVEDRGRVEKQ